MTVNDILEKIGKIDHVKEEFARKHFDDSHVDQLLDLLDEYKEELLSKKIAK